jgi:hypothetical protein
MIEVVMSVESDRYDTNDDRWLDQVRDLHTDLRAQGTGLRVQSMVVPGTKGSIDTVILALGSAGVFSSAVDCFKGWLAREKSRRIVVTWSHDGRDERIVFEGDAVDQDSMLRLTEAIGQQLGRAAWQTDTRPS